MAPPGPPSNPDRAASRASALRRPPPVTLTHPDKLLWPEDGITKHDLAAWYEKAAPRLMPHIVGRPVTLVRAPDGIAGRRFVQRHPMLGLPASLAVRLPGAPRPFLMVNGPEGLRALAQAAVVEIHPWGATVRDIDRPDLLVFDLDPAEGVPIARVAEAAHAVRAALRDFGLAGFAKTTGGKGLHVVVPLVPEAGWPAAKAFARSLCDALIRESPGRFTRTAAMQARTGLIFLDYLRNDKMASSIAPWSPRARPGAPVAMPLHWDEVGPDLSPRAFTLRSAAPRLEDSSLWGDFAAAARPLPHTRPG